MKIEKVSIDSIKVYPNNAKIHTAEQIEEIKKSIQEFGNNDPIAIDEKGFIIEGEGRYLAQKDMGLKEIEVIKLTHLSEEQKVAYMLVHNKLTMNTGFDIDILEEELAKISNIDMQEFEFDIKQLEEELENEVNTSSESSFNYKEQYGAIGFHPSLLPRHRGQDAVRWTTAMNDSITGATVFWLDDSVDGGDIFLQKTLFVDRKWNYHDLWREIFPIGVEMICKAVDLIEEGNIIKIPQDEKYATWEPSFTNTRLKRNELLQIGNGINI